MTNAVVLLLIAGLLIWTIAGRLTGRPLKQRRLLVVPAILTVVGLAQLGGVHLTATAIGLLVAQGVLSAGIGAVRGLTIHLYAQDGHLWFRYRWVTVGLWVLAIAVRLAFAAGERIMHVDAGTSQALMIGLGVSLLAEGLVVMQRAAATGVPFAPDDRTRRRTLA